MGFLGYYAGPLVHFIDFHGLTDPLISRLPSVKTKTWRIGHFRRIVPPLYPESVEQNANLLLDSDLALFYDKIKIITQGELFSGERLLTILRMNLGLFDHLIDRQFYRDPITTRVSWKDCVCVLSRAVCGMPPER